MCALFPKGSYIPDLTDTDQTWFVQTQDHVRCSVHIIQSIRETEAVLASLDTEKALDCVSWNDLVLEQFGFTENSINRIKAFILCQNESKWTSV